MGKLNTDMIREYYNREFEPASWERLCETVRLVRDRDWDKEFNNITLVVSNPVREKVIEALVQLGNNHKFGRGPRTLQER